MLRFLLVALIVGIVVPAISAEFMEISQQSNSNAGAAIQPTTHSSKDWKTAKLVQSIAIAVDRVVLSPDGKMLAVRTQTASGSAIVQLWDINTGKTIYSFSNLPDQRASDAISFSPNGKILAISHYSPFKKALIIQLWNIQSKQLIRTLTSILESKTSTSTPPEGSTVLFSPDSKTLVSSAESNSIIQLWDVQQGVVRSSLPGTGSSVFAFSPDSQILATSQSQSMTLWNVKTKARIRTLSGNQSIGNIVFSRDGKTLINTYESMEKGIQRWDVRTGKLIRTFNYGFHWSENPVFSSDGQYLASGSSYAPLRVYDLRTNQPTFESQNFLVAGGVIVFSADGSTLAGITDGTKVKIWW